MPDADRHLDDTEELDVHLVPLTNLLGLINTGHLGGMSSAAAALWGLTYLNQEKGTPTNTDEHR